MAADQPGESVIGSTGCVVVHHKSLGTLFRTVELIIANGIDPRQIVVVDNSEQPQMADAIRQALAAEVALVRTPNTGYAAAANLGAAHLREHSNPEFVVVSTHEVQPRRDAIQTMLAAMDTDSSIAVVGPTLVNADDPYSTSASVWSTGGALSRFLGLPAHTGAGKSVELVVQESGPGVEPRDREWLDGAFCLYRAAALQLGMREDFFLYTEELEFHTRLRSLGFRVVWAPQSIATQQTNGTPAYYQARNIQIFLRLWGSLFQRIVSVPYLVMRQSLLELVRRRDSPQASLRRSLKGLRDGWAHEIR